MNRNIKYKQVCRLQFFGDDNIYDNARFQYSTVNTSIINAIRLRFDLRGNLGDVVLSKNARIIVESAYIQALTNTTSRVAVLRLVTSTEDKTFDSKKGINGNPILFCLNLSATVNALTTLYYAHDMYYCLNIPSNFLSKGFIEMELEVPSQTSLSIAFVNNLANFCFSFLIIDYDPELTLDNTLAPPIDYNNYNVNIPIRPY